MTNTTRTPAQVAEIDARLDRVLAATIIEVNELLGGRKVSYGYIGNDDDRSYRVFLPNNKSAGGHAAGDLEGKKKVVEYVAALREGILLGRGL